MATSSQRNRKTKSRELKTERMELRLKPSARRIIQRAMSVTGMGAGDLAYEGARRVLAEHECMLLVGADREVFLEAVRNPPRPARKLVAVLKRHRDLFG